MPLQSSTATILCDVSTGVPRPLVPIILRRQVFQAPHTLAHPGIQATQHLVTARFVWPRINHDVRSWTRACLQCQKSKVQKHTSAPLPKFYACGFRYLLTAVDRFTRWPEVIPISDITATSVAKAFVGCVSRFGVPSIITTDRGSQFESALWKELSILLGCSRIRTTAYHPAANGLIERFHRLFKASLTACKHSSNWVESLPLVLLGIRTAPKEDLHCSTARWISLWSYTSYTGRILLFQSIYYSNDPSTYASQLRLVMKSLRAVPPRVNYNYKPFN